MLTLAKKLEKFVTEEGVLYRLRWEALEPLLGKSLALRHIENPTPLELVRIEVATKARTAIKRFEKDIKRVKTAATDFIAQAKIHQWGSDSQRWSDDKFDKEALAVLREFSLYLESFLSTVLEVFHALTTYPLDWKLNDESRLSVKDALINLIKHMIGSKELKLHSLAGSFNLKHGFVANDGLRTSVYAHAVDFDEAARAIWQMQTYLVSAVVGQYMCSADAKKFGITKLTPAQYQKERMDPVEDLDVEARKKFDFLKTKHPLFAEYFLDHDGRPFAIPIGYHMSGGAEMEGETAVLASDASDADTRAVDGTETSSSDGDSHSNRSSGEVKLSNAEQLYNKLAERCENVFGSAAMTEENLDVLRRYSQAVQKDRVQSGATQDASAAATASAAQPTAEKSLIDFDTDMEIKSVADDQASGAGQDGSDSFLVSIGKKYGLDLTLKLEGSRLSQQFGGLQTPTGSRTESEDLIAARMKKLEEEAKLPHREWPRRRFVLEWEIMKASSLTNDATNPFGVRSEEVGKLLKSDKMEQLLMPFVQNENNWQLMIKAEGPIFEPKPGVAQAVFNAVNLAVSPFASMQYAATPVATSPFAATSFAASPLMTPGIGMFPGVAPDLSDAFAERARLEKTRYQMMKDQITAHGADLWSKGFNVGTAKTHVKKSYTYLHVVLSEPGKHRPREGLDRLLKQIATNDKQWQVGKNELKSRVFDDVIWPAVQRMVEEVQSTDTAVNLDPIKKTKPKAEAAAKGQPAAATVVHSPAADEQFARMGTAMMEDVRTQIHQAHQGAQDRGVKLGKLKLDGHVHTVVAAADAAPAPTLKQSVLEDAAKIIKAKQPSMSTLKLRQLSVLSVRTNFAESPVFAEAASVAATPVLPMAAPGQMMSPTTVLPVQGYLYGGYGTIWSGGRTLTAAASMQAPSIHKVEVPGLGMGGNGI